MSIFEIHNEYPSYCYIDINLGNDDFWRKETTVNYINDRFLHYSDKYNIPVFLTAFIPDSDPDVGEDIIRIGIEAPCIVSQNNLFTEYEISFSLVSDKENGDTLNFVLRLFEAELVRASDNKVLRNFGIRLDIINSVFLI